MQSLEQLKKLVFEGGWDDESKQHVATLEQQLHDIAVKEKLADDPVIKPFISYLQGKIDRAELLLKTDRTLTDSQRQFLFATIELADHFTSIFNGRARGSVEATITHLLDKAINH